MGQAMSLTLKVVEKAVGSYAAAFRCITKLQPVGGIGDKVFPPTYEGGKYALEERVAANGEVIQCVLIDSVQSQANRMEAALLDAVQSGKLPLPLLTVRFDQNRLKKKLMVTSLDAPHRVADAIFRDSLLDGVCFRKSQKGQILDSADIRNATGLFGLCPTALLFGLWDSTGPRGGLGAKFQRAIVSEIVGYNAVVGVKTSSRIDPLQVVLGAGPLYERKDKDSQFPDWTLSEEEAIKDKKKNSLKLGKDGKPSEANHGNVTPGITTGGITISHALQTSVISLAALRRLRFPLDGATASLTSVDNAARTALAALGLAAATLSQEDGLDLRSRCQLFPSEKVSWEIIESPNGEPERFTLDSTGALSLVISAVEKAKEAGLPWEGNIDLEPCAALVELVARSQDLASSDSREES